MDTIRHYLLFLLLTLALPLSAQTIVTDNEDDETTDTTMVAALPSDSLPWPQGAQHRIEKLLESDMFRTSQVGLMVYDLTADSTLYALNEQQLMRPASTMKTLTAITALDKLGGSFRFQTELCYTGQIQNGTLTGDVYCVGGFDPLFSADDMKAFVSSLQKMGVDTIRGRLFADKSMKDMNTLGEGWCWDDDNPVLTPLLYGRKDKFMERFAEELRDAGVTVQAFSSVQTKPDSAYCITRRFHTIDQVLIPMLKKSDNLFAEAMFYQLGAASGNKPSTAKSSAGVVKRLIQKVGLDPARYRVADGSGLSLYNYVSAEMEVRLLKYAYRHENIYLHLQPSLPEAGVDGTLHKRMRGAFTRGNVYAKTGTVAGISSLCGYAKASNGHVLCFCIINQGLMHGKNGRTFQDRVCEALCAPY